MIEDQFISAILNNKITIEQINDSGFETDWLKLNAEIYEYIDNYYSQNNILPSIELVETRYPIFKCVEVKDQPIEILDALRKNTELNRFNSMMKQAIKLANDTGDVNKALTLVEKKMDKFHTTARTSTYDITSPSFTMGREDYLKRNSAYLNGGTYGIPTGFGKELDGFFNGGYQEGFYGFLGKSGMRKTWLALLSGVACFQSGKTPLFIGLEGSVREYYRILTLLAQSSNSGFLSGKLTMDEYDFSERKLRELAQKMGVKFLVEFMGDRDVFTPRDMRKIIRKYNPDEIIVDYVTLMRKEADANSYDDFLDVSQQIAVMATGFHKPIIGVFQGVIKPGVDTLGMEDVAQSKGMVRDINYMMGVNSVEGNDKLIRINDAKARDGVGGFDAYYTTDLDKGIIKFNTIASGEWDFV